MNSDTKKGIIESVLPILKSLQCPICYEVFKSPVYTGCGHFFCRICIKELMKDNYRMPCPLCQRPFTRRSIHEANQRNSIVLAAQTLVKTLEKFIGESCVTARFAEKYKENASIGNTKADLPPTQSRERACKKRKSDEAALGAFHKHNTSDDSQSESEVNEKVHKETTSLTNKRSCQSFNIDNNDVDDDDDFELPSLESIFHLPNTVSATNDEGKDVIAPTEEATSKPVAFTNRVPDYTTVAKNIEDNSNSKGSLNESDCDDNSSASPLTNDVKSKKVFAMKTKRNSCTQQLESLGPLSSRLKKNAFENKNIQATSTNNSLSMKLGKANTNEKQSEESVEDNIIQNNNSNFDVSNSPAKKKIKQSESVLCSRKKDKLTVKCNNAERVENDSSVLSPSTNCAPVDNIDNKQDDCELEKTSVSCTNLHRVSFEIDESESTAEDSHVTNTAITVEAVASPSTNKAVPSLKSPGWSRLKQDEKDFKMRMFSRLHVKKNANSLNDVSNLDVDMVCPIPDKSPLKNLKIDKQAKENNVTDETNLNATSYNVDNNENVNYIPEQIDLDYFEEDPMLSINVGACHTSDELNNVHGKDKKKNTFCGRPSSFQNVQNTTADYCNENIGNSDQIQQEIDFYSKIKTNVNGTPLLQVTKAISKSNLNSKFLQLPNRNVTTTELVPNPNISFADQYQQTSQRLIEHWDNRKTSTPVCNWNAQMLNKQGTDGEKTKVLKRACLTLDEIQEHFSLSNTFDRTENICSLPFSTDFRLHISVSDGTLNVSVLQILNPSKSSKDCLTKHVLMSEKNIHTCGPSSPLGFLPSSNPDSVCSQSNHLHHAEELLENKFSYLNGHNLDIPVISSLSYDPDKQPMSDNGDLEIEPTRSRRDSFQIPYLGQEDSLIKSKCRIDGLNEKIMFGHPTFKKGGLQYVEKDDRANVQDEIPQHVDSFIGDEVSRNEENNNRIITPERVVLELEKQTTSTILEKNALLTPEKRYTVNSQPKIDPKLNKSSLIGLEKNPPLVDLERVSPLVDLEIISMDISKSPEIKSTPSKQNIEYEIELGSKSNTVTPNSKLYTKSIPSKVDPKSSLSVVLEKINLGDIVSPIEESIVPEQNSQCQKLDYAINKKQIPISPLEGSPEEFNPFKNIPNTNSHFSQMIVDSDEYSSDPDMNFATELVAPLKFIAQKMDTENNEHVKTIQHVEQTVMKEKLNRESFIESNDISMRNTSMKSSRMSLKLKKVSPKFRRIRSYRSSQESDSSSGIESSPVKKESLPPTVPRDQNSLNTLSEDLTNANSCDIALEIEDLDQKIKSVEEKLKLYGHSNLIHTKKNALTDIQNVEPNHETSFKSENSNDSFDVFSQSVPPTP